MHIVLATPTGGWVRAPHYRCKAIMQAQCSGHRFTHAEVDLLIVSKARNDLIKVLPEDADAIWFIDSDVLLPTNAPLLIDHLKDHPVVSGLYFGRTPPNLPQVYNRATPGHANFAFLPVIDIPAEPFMADAVGAGCLLIQTQVLRDIADKHKAWQDEVRAELDRVDFLSSLRRAAELGASLSPHFEFLEAVGEDFYFCMQLQHYLGIRPLVVPAVECPHETIVPLGRAQFEANLGAGLVSYNATFPTEDRGVLAA